MKEFFFFHKMFTRSFIQFIYWLFLAVAWIGALALGITLMSQGGVMILAGLVAFVLIGLVYSIGARIWCELMIVIFEIHAELVAIRGAVAPPVPHPAGFPVTPAAPHAPPSA
jgi:hypothetical protein